MGDSSSYFEETTTDGFSRVINDCSHDDICDQSALVPRMVTRKFKLANLFVDESGNSQVDCS